LLGYLSFAQRTNYMSYQTQVMNFSEAFANGKQKDCSGKTYRDQGMFEGRDICPSYFP